MSTALGEVVGIHFLCLISLDRWRWHWRPSVRIVSRVHHSRTNKTNLSIHDGSQGASCGSQKVKGRLCTVQKTSCEG